MGHVFTTIIERDEKWFVAWCPEVLGANGGGLTKEECHENLAAAVELTLEEDQIA